MKKRHKLKKKVKKIHKLQKRKSQTSLKMSQTNRNKVVNQCKKVTQSDTNMSQRVANQ